MQSLAFLRIPAPFSNRLLRLSFAFPFFVAVLFGPEVYTASKSRKTIWHFEMAGMLGYFVN